MFNLKWTVTTAILVSCVGCGSRSGPDAKSPFSSLPGKSDLSKRIQGTYRVISAKFREDDKNDLVNFTITFEGDRMIANDLRNPMPKTMRFRIEETKTPKHIDTWPDGADPANGADLGLIQLDGEFLELCMTPGRPVRAAEVKNNGGKDAPVSKGEDGATGGLDRRTFMVRPAGLSPEFGMYIVMKRVRN